MEQFSKGQLVYCVGHHRKFWPIEVFEYGELRNRGETTYHIVYNGQKELNVSARAVFSKRSDAVARAKMLRDFTVTKLKTLKWEE